VADAAETPGLFLRGSPDVAGLMTALQMDVYGIPLFHGTPADHKRLIDQLLFRGKAA